MTTSDKNSLITLITSWSNIHYTKKQYLAHLEDNTLDIILININQTIVEALQLTKIFAQSHQHEIQQLLNHANENLATQKQNIISFYIEYFKSHSIINTQIADCDVDLIVVLGCNHPCVEHRISFAAEHIKKHPNARVLVTGGGFNLAATEGRYMQKQLEKHHITNNILVEELSMDTIANALFSKIMLRKEGLLNTIKHIKIITSKFHVLRAMHYFDTIFNSHVDNPVFHFCGQGVSTSTKENIESLSEHELSSEFQSMQTLSVFNDSTMLINDNQSLIELIKNHTLYQSRFDILRELLPYAD